MHNMVAPPNMAMPQFMVSTLTAANIGKKLIVVRTIQYAMAMTLMGIPCHLVSVSLRMRKQTTYPYSEPERCVW